VEEPYEAAHVLDPLQELLPHIECFPCRCLQNNNNNSSKLHQLTKPSHSIAGSMLHILEHTGAIAMQAYFKAWVMKA
jgi:hypothetical protein